MNKNSYVENIRCHCTKFIHPGGQDSCTPAKNIFFTFLLDHNMIQHSGVTHVMILKYSCYKRKFFGSQLLLRKEKNF